MKMTGNVPEHLSDRVWYMENSAYSFLVHAPIAFGHSQLRVSITPDILEEDAFSIAAKHIAICISRFRSTFESLDLSEWNPLARYTSSSGEYVKTLVLKASSDENQKEEYKVHLVPCFSSNIENANRLFLERFGKKEKGGLLYWIGQREHLVDYDTLRLDAVAEQRIKSFCLTGLASILRCPSQPAKTA